MWTFETTTMSVHPSKTCSHLSHLFVLIYEYQAAKVAPRDPDLRRKLSECEKAVKRIRFEEALSSPDSVVQHVSDTIVLEDIIVEEDYKVIE
jgi:hypothetical protein